MQSTIKRLKEQATANIADGQPLDTYGVIGGASDWKVFGVMIANGEALQIAEILERASYPPIVRAALALIELRDADLSGKDWVSVDCHGNFKLHSFKPETGQSKGFWREGYLFSYISTQSDINPEISETLIFQRTPDGWKWAFAENHKPAQ